MKRYKLDILGISWSRWTTSGRIKTTTGETVLYSGGEDDSHHEGVCNHHDERNGKVLYAMESVCSRIIQTRFKARIGRLTCPS